MSRNVATLADPPASDAERASRRAAMRLWSVEELRAFLAQDYQDGDLVLAREDGAPIHPEQLTRTFRRHVAAAGLGPIRLHDLRHTRATLLMAWGAHPKVVQERLRHHSAPFTLDAYSHVTPARAAPAGPCAVRWQRPRDGPPLTAPETTKALSEQGFRERE